MGIARTPARINHDAAMHLQCGALVLEGKLPYVDFIDVNPPLIMYLNAIPALLARVTGLALPPVFNLTVLVLAVWSMWVVQRQLWRWWPGPRPSVVALPGVLFAAFNLIVWRSGDFGQREHLFVLLFMPFLVMRWRRWSGGGAIPRWAARALGVAAALGACVKPQFLVLAVAAEAWPILVRRDGNALLRPEVTAFAWTVLFYVIHFFVLPPVMRDEWLLRWVPFLMRSYGLYGIPWPALITGPIVACALVSAGTLALAIAVPRLRNEALGMLAGMLAAFTAAAVAVYLGQGKGWTYHRLPALAGAMVLLGVVWPVAFGCATALGTRARRRGAQAVALVAGAAVLAGCIGPVRPLLRGPAPAYWVQPFAPVVARYSRDRDSVLFISTSVVPAYPTLLLLNRRPGSRYLWFFPIAAFANDIPLRPGGRPRYRYWADVTEEERRFLEELAMDIAVRRPALIFVGDHEGAQGCPRRFRVLQYLERLGFVRRSMRGYQPLAPVSGFAVFVATERIGGE